MKFGNFSCFWFILPLQICFYDLRVNSKSHRFKYTKAGDAVDITNKSLSQVNDLDGQCIHYTYFKAPETETGRFLGNDCKLWNHRVTQHENIRSSALLTF